MTQNPFPPQKLGARAQKVVDNIDINIRAQGIHRDFIMLTGATFYMHNVENYLRAKGHEALTAEDRQRLRRVINKCTLRDASDVEILHEALQHTRAMMGR